MCERDNWVASSNTMPDRGVGRLGCPPEVGVSPILLFVAFGFSHPTHLGIAALSPKFGCHELGCV